MRKDKKQRSGGCSAVVGLLLAIVVVSAGYAQTQPAFAVADSIKDIYVPARLTRVSLSGYLDSRTQINQNKRLLTISLHDILMPYANRGTAQMWAGEYIGKYIHAACYTWAYTRDLSLKARLDSAVQALIGYQKADGYLGTYHDDDHWTSWDVWAHKYNLIGLLTYYGFTGHDPSLSACRKIGDLLCNTFGPGKPIPHIVNTGTHEGMAATSVLEPMVMLYRCTGEQRYLDFCEYMVDDWQNRPDILRDLLANRDPAQISNGKIYEMTSCIVGLADLYRMTGTADYLTACTNAWKSIMENHHYMSGTMGVGEHYSFPDNLDLAWDLGEGCVTVTWEQLNWHLLRLTGKPEYAHELERITFNALLAAQSPVTGKLCYFTGLNGWGKPYGQVNHGIEPDVCCCSASLPRGIALISQFMTGAINGQPAVILYTPTDSYSVNAAAQDGAVAVTMKIETRYPEDGNVVVTVTPSRESTFSLMLRVPDWCSSYSAHIGNDVFTGETGKFLTIQRTWKSGDQVTIAMDMPIRIIPGGSIYPGKVSLERGPQILATDDNLRTTPPALPAGWVGTQAYIAAGSRNGENIQLELVPFADAAQSGGYYESVVDTLTEVASGLGGNPARPKASQATGILTVSPLKGNAIRIRYAISPESRHQRVSLVVLDLQGRLLRTLASRVRDPGIHDKVLDLRGDRGGSMPTGMILLVLRCGSKAHSVRYGPVRQWL